MIDTDKYEGHTEGPWGWFSSSTLSDANKLLMADAPLLLAEVKRLREIEREWRHMWDKLEDYPDICAELICFMESEEE